MVELMQVGDFVACHTAHGVRVVRIGEKEELRFKKKRATTLELANHPYGTCFRAIPSEEAVSQGLERNAVMHEKLKRREDETGVVLPEKRSNGRAMYYTLVAEPRSVVRAQGLKRVSEFQGVLEVDRDLWEHLKDPTAIAMSKRAKDNRSVGVSEQKLDGEATEALMASTDADIGTKLAEIAKNNEGFQHKTEFSQEKYLNKKRKAYDLFMRTSKPTTRLVAEFMGKDPFAIGMIRVADTLPQMLSRSSISGSSRALVFDSYGGLLTAAALERVVGGTGKVVNVQTKKKIGCQALKFFNHSEETLKTYYEDVRLDDLDLDAHENSFDALLVNTHFDVVEVVFALLRYLKPSRSFCVYSLTIQPLMELYKALDDYRQRGSPLGRGVSEGASRPLFAAMRVLVSETMCREHQVLPGRTHPVMRFDNANGGYLLSGVKTSTSAEGFSGVGLVPLEHPRNADESSV